MRELGADKRLKIAIQKQGRLYDGSIKLFNKCGLKVMDTKQKLSCRVENFPIDILFIRDDDIPGFVEEGIADLGIIGENTYLEYSLQNSRELSSKKLMGLNFAKCKLSIAVKDTDVYSSIKDLSNKKIATSYPGIMKNYLSKNSISAEVVVMNGSVEVAPQFGIADVICDLISSGMTLQANSLVQKDTILSSEAILINNPKFINEEKSKITDLLLKRISGVMKASGSKYITLNAPKKMIEKITEILPGVDSPTVMDLQDDDMIAVHAVCSEQILWETLEELKNIGATNLLVMPIEKILM